MMFTDGVGEKGQTYSLTTNEFDDVFRLPAPSIG